MEQQNLTIQQKEQQILSTIIACKKVMYGDNSNVEQDVKLFESVTGMYGEITHEQIEQCNPIPFENFQLIGDNKYAYLNTVRSFVYGDKNSSIMKPLNENQMFDPFKDELEQLIKELEKDNAFNQLDFVDKQILQTKLFARQPISVLGYNLMQTIKALDSTSDLQGVFSILFNKTTKEIYFIRNGEVLVYNIKTNDYSIMKNPVLDATNYKSVISNEISANVVEIYENPELTIKNLKEGFTDNLFHDKKRTQELMQYQQDIRFLK